MAKEGNTVLSHRQDQLTANSLRTGSQLKSNSCVAAAGSSGTSCLSALPPGGTRSPWRSRKVPSTVAELLHHDMGHTQAAARGMRSLACTLLQRQFNARAAAARGPKLG